MDGAGLDLEIHALEGHHAAIALGEVVDGDERRPWTGLANEDGSRVARLLSIETSYSDSAAMGCMPLGQSLLRTLSDQGL